MKINHIKSESTKINPFEDAKDVGLGIEDKLMLAQRSVTYAG